jgi:hypothetical protein
MRMKLGRPALLATIVALLAPAAAHGGAPPLRPFPLDGGGRDAAGARTDRLRYLVINASPGTVRVYDTDTKTFEDVTVRPECTMRGVTVNFALIGCTDDTRPTLLRLKTRELEPIEEPQRQDDFEWSDIGRNWLVGGFHANRAVTVYLNWRTGATATFDAFDDAPRDLDLPNLTAYSPSHVVMLRDGPFVMKDTRPTRHKQVLDLVRKGGARLRLSKCPKNACGRPYTGSGAALSQGFAAWTEGATGIRAYDSRTGRRFSWDVEDPEYEIPFLPGLTRRYLFVSQPADHPSGGDRLLWARVRK